MTWLSVTLTVDAGYVEKLSDALLVAGALAIDVSDADAGTPRERFSFNEPGERDTLVTWERTKLSALFPEQADVTSSMIGALQAAGCASTQNFEINRLEDQDWVRVTRDQFKPIHVSPRVWVVPTWHAPVPAAINLAIDPGPAFGTGTHPTTRLCLAWLDANVRGGETVLDYGCGSGILAIAALKLGAAHALGVDVDATALLAARNNAMQNQVTAQFETADSAATEPVDIVLANILANPLKLLAPLLTRAACGGGHIVLSGVLDHQSDEVWDAYREWFDIESKQYDDGWVLLHGTRHLD